LSQGGEQVGDVTLLNLNADEFLVKYDHAIIQATGSELQAAILSGKGARRLLEYANSKRN
jgi:hypothetical protein